MLAPVEHAEQVVVWVSFCTRATAGTTHTPAGKRALLSAGALRQHEIWQCHCADCHEQQGEVGTARAGMAEGEGLLRDPACSRSSI